MGSITEAGNLAFRDHVTEGVPATGVNEPDKSEIRQVFGIIDAALSSLAAGVILDGVVVKETLAALDADLAHDAETLGFVYGDETDENNGIYVKAGASGSGGWSLVPGLTLPATFATDIAAAIAAGEAAQAAQTAAEAAQDAAETAAADALEAADDAADAMETALAAANAAGAPTTIAKTYAQARAALYGISASALALAFSTDGVELLFDKGYYRKGTEVEAAVADLTGWAQTITGARTGIDASGNLVSFATGVLPNVTGKGVLVESTKSPLLQYTEDVTNGVYTKIGVTATGNAAADPLGATTADRLTEDSATSIHAAIQTATVSPSTVYSFGWMLKAGTRSWAQLVENGGSGCNAYFNLATGVVGTVTGGAASITPVGGGWYRCSLTFTTGAAQTTGNCQVRLATGNGVSTTYAGDGASYIDVWGCGLEPGQLTSYIPRLTSAAVTRTVPDLVLTGNFVTPCTLLVEYQRASDNGTTSAVVQIDAGSNTDNLLYYISASDLSRGFVVVGGVTQADTGPGASVPVSTPSAVAIRFQTDNTASARNGSAGAADTSATMPTGLNKLRVGARVGPATAGEVYIKRIVYLPFAMTDAQLQAASTIGNFEDRIVEVSVDETQNDQLTRYRITDGALVGEGSLSAAARTGVFQTKTAITTTKVSPGVERIILRGDIPLAPVDDTPDHDAHVTDGNGQVWDYRPTHGVGDFRAIGYLAGATDDDGCIAASIAWLNALGEPGQSDAPARKVRLYGDVVVTESWPPLLVSNAYLDGDGARILPDGVDGPICSTDGIAAGAMLFRCGLIGDPLIEYVDDPTVNDCILATELTHAPSLSVRGENVGRVCVIGQTNDGRATKPHIKFVGNGANIGAPVFEFAYCDVSSMDEESYYYTQGVGIPVHDGESELEVAVGRNIFEFSKGSHDTSNIRGLYSHGYYGVFSDAYNVIVQNGWVHDDCVLDFMKMDSIYLGSRSDAGVGGSLHWVIGAAYLCSWEGRNFTYAADALTANRGHMFRGTRMVCAGLQHIGPEGVGNTSSGDISFIECQYGAANRMDDPGDSEAILLGWDDGVGRNFVLKGGRPGRAGTEDGFPWQADVGVRSFADLPGLEVTGVHGDGVSANFDIPPNTVPLADQLVYGNFDAEYAIYRDSGDYVAPATTVPWVNPGPWVINVAIGNDGTGTLISLDGSYTGLSQASEDIWPGRSITAAADPMPTFSFRTRG